MPSPLHLFSRRLLIVLGLLASASAFSKPVLATTDTPQSSVTVSDDSLKVYSDATSESSLITTLTKGTQITVRLRIGNSEGAWCKIEMKAQQDQPNQGFVHCSGLSGNLQPQPKDSNGSAPKTQAASPPSADLGIKENIPHCVDAPIPSKLQGGGQIYLVPIGPYPPVVFDYLRDCYARRFGLDIRTLPEIPIDPGAANNQRQQLIGESLLDELNRKYASLASRGAVLIGFTKLDMYLLGEPNWAWAFGVGDSRSGVISTARFAVRMNDEAVTTSVILSRFRKALGRYLGRLYYQLPLNSNPQSLMYYKMLGIDDLDAISEDY